MKYKNKMNAYVCIELSAALEMSFHELQCLPQRKTCGAHKVPFNYFNRTYTNYIHTKYSNRTITI